MVGGENSDRSKEAAGMMALHEALRSLCLTSDWTYSVFWTIRPRPRFRGGSASKLGDDNGSLMLMWEDGFCKPTVAEGLEEDLVKKAFIKMSIQLYNYGEGLMGKVASDKCHKWILKDPSECEPSVSNYWQSSFDALPPEWIDQFNSGIQTIAVIQAGHGLLQLGSCKIIPEDLHFVLRMRHTFESLGYQSGFFLSQLFPSPTSSTSRPPPPPVFNLSQGPAPAGMGLPTKVEPHHFLVPQAIDTNLQEMVHDHDSELKWPTGLSFFNALTGRPEDSKLLFGGVEALGEKPGSSSHHDASSRDEVQPCHADHPSSNVDESREEDANKGSSAMHDADSHGHHYHTVGDYRSSEAGTNSDKMGAFLE